MDDETRIKKQLYEFLKGIVNNLERVFEQTLVSPDYMHTQGNPRVTILDYSLLIVMIPNSTENNCFCLDGDAAIEDILWAKSDSQGYFSSLGLALKEKISEFLGNKSCLPYEEQCKQLMTLMCTYNGIDGQKNNAEHLSIGPFHSLEYSYFSLIFFDKDKLNSKLHLTKENRKYVFPLFASIFNQFTSWVQNKYLVKKNGYDSIQFLNKHECMLIVEYASIGLLLYCLGMEITEGVDKDTFSFLYTGLNAISAQQYEKKNCEAQLAISKEGTVLNILEFKDRISVKDTRCVRKLLEATGSENALVCNGKEVIGIAAIEDLCDEHTIIVKFLGHLEWEAYCCGESLLHYKEGNIRVKWLWEKSLEALNKNPVANIIPEKIKMANLIDKVIESRHGSTLVFSNRAKGEAERLKGESFRVEPFEMTADNITSLSAIDGAVLLGYDCNCYAIGTILDGLAGSEQADRSRGARYNSAWRYYDARSTHSDDDQRDHPFIVVISDDGMVDYIPGPEPATKKAESN